MLLECGLTADFVRQLIEDGDIAMSPSAQAAQGIADWDEIFAPGHCGVWHHYATDCSGCPFRWGEEE